MKNSQASCDKKRRSFLKMSGILGMSALATSLLPVERSEALPFTSTEYKVTKTRLAMGTFVAITAIHSSRDEAENAIGLAFEEIDRLNNVLSRYKQSTAVSELNAEGVLKNPSLEIQEMIGRSLYFHRQTAGAFDITVGPLIDLYKESFAKAQQPGDAEIKEVLQRIGSQHLRFEGSGIAMARPGMSITLDGIGKGYVVDRASEVLVQNGVTNHLINAGGDIRASGNAAKGRPWTIAIQDPNKHKDYPDIITMTDGAIATSGNYEIFYDREKIFHHIVNSKTGHSPQFLTSASITAKTVMDADAMATAVFVMEPKDAMVFIENQSESECFLIGEDKKIAKSSGWQV
ncbi:FAD:protein FMN transferase [Desulfotalea psychrophila]|uniref:FAD:protein FMN transferase n=1 Tax=Desulfotalea psychrophila (strain LSv54 / DSM 12343) TaxID=177439 RepID=Q6AQ68_DESPS|nr:FAD:protein FMN transferase [Desulfotalea psychrophila]CAG35505.1 related to thiamine biosynthesis lipoprotein (ApbE) [Precursor] [Desulfotalea psychrophila LSv54]